MIDIVAIFEPIDRRFVNDTIGYSHSISIKMAFFLATIAVSRYLSKQ